MELSQDEREKIARRSTELGEAYSKDNLLGEVLDLIVEKNAPVQSIVLGSDTKDPSSPSP